MSEADPTPPSEQDLADPGAHAPPADEKAGLSNLSLRLIAAALLIPPIACVIWLGGIPFLLGVILIAVLALREFYGLIRGKGAHALATPGMIAAGALPVVAYLGNEYHATILMTAVLLGVMVAQLRKREISEALESISGTFFGVFYVGWLLSHAVVLRNFHAVVASKWGAEVALAVPPEVGRYYLFLVVTVAASCDAGAYFVGRAFGKRKLAPEISPAKTVEGALGGLVAGLAAALLVRGIFTLFWPELVPAQDSLAWMLTGVTGVILAAVGIVGDLIESLLKRDAHVKDTGHLIPGSGGVLDRIDSHLLAIPVLYYIVLVTTYLRLGV